VGLPRLPAARLVGSVKTKAGEHPSMFLRADECGCLLLLSSKHFDSLNRGTHKATSMTGQKVKSDPYRRKALVLECIYGRINQCKVPTFALMLGKPSSRLPWIKALAFVTSQHRPCI